MKAIKKLIPPLVVACLSVLLNAQSTSPVTSTSNKSQVSNISNSAELTPVQEQAVLILKQLSEKVKKIHDDELRISTEALIADILWKYDQPLARRLFQNAFRSTELISDEENPIISFGGSPRTSLRTKLLSLIIKHDPSFAEELLKSIPESRSQTDAANIGERAKLSLSLAPYLIASDPQRAGALIKQSLGNRLSFELMLALNWLRGKDRKLADDLFIQALSKVEINPETPFADLMLISFYFSDLEDKAANEPTPQATQPDSIPPNLIEPVLNLAFKAITLQDQKEQREAGRERKKRMVMFDLMDHGMMAGFLPLFEKYQPERAGIIRSRLVKIEGELPDSVKNPSPKPSTAEDFLKEAQQTDIPILKEISNQRAATKAAEDGNYDLAISTASRLSDPLLANMYRRMAVFAAIEKGDIDAGLKYANGITDQLERAGLYGRLAQEAFDQSNTKRAEELLKAAEELMVNASSKSDKASSLLDLAESASMNTERGFAILKLAVEAINNEFPPNAQEGRREYPPGVESFDGNFGVLAQKDFSRSLALAQTIKREELAIQAMISACRAVLGHKPERLSRPKQK